MKIARMADQWARAHGAVLPRVQGSGTSHRRRVRSRPPMDCIPEPAWHGLGVLDRIIAAEEAALGLWTPQGGGRLVKTAIDPADL